MKTHTAILKLGTALTIIPEMHKGICYGFSLKLLEYYLLDHLKDFQNRIKEITIIADDNDIIEKIKLLIKNRPSDFKQIDNEESLWEIPLLYIQMMLYQGPEVYLSPQLNQYDIFQISQEASPMLSRRFGGLVSIYSEIGIYSKEEITKQLEEFAFVFDQLNQPDKIGFILKSLNHVILLFYQKNRLWSFININDDESIFGEKLYTVDETANAIFDGFRRYSPINEVNYIEGQLSHVEAEVALQTKDKICTIKLEYTTTTKKEMKFELTYFPALSGWVFTNEIEQKQVSSKLINKIAKSRKIMAQQIIKHAYTEENIPHISFSTKIITTMSSENNCSFGHRIKALKQQQSITRELVVERNITHLALIASLENELNIIQTLLNHHVDFSKICMENNISLLHLAAQYNHEDMVRLLLTQSTILDTQTLDGRTPIYLAAEKGHISIVKILAEAGANVIISANNGLSPIDVATQRGYQSIIEILTRYVPQVVENASAQGIIISDCKQTLFQPQTSHLENSASNCCILS